MERHHRNIPLILIGGVIALAVFSSFVLPFFVSSTPQIVLPTPQPSFQMEHVGMEDSGERQVEVTPQTVQGVIGALKRLDSYTRIITTTLEGTMTTTQVWTEGGWTRTELLTPAGLMVHTIVGDGQVWRWYDDGQTVVSWEADQISVDVEGQRLPTYEDVLELDRERITDAGYEDKNGLPCVYVEASFPELDQLERYWISADNGLLEAAETKVDGRVVWTMSASGTEIPSPDLTERFTLPDGQVLYQSDPGDQSETESAIAEE